MCYRPLKIVNPHYKMLARNNDVDLNRLYEHLGHPDDWILEVGCGKCEQCFKKDASSWRLRLVHEFQYSNTAWFVTLTIDDSHYNFVKDHPEKAMRSFFETVRKRYKRSVKHFFITELGGDHKKNGGTATKRLHFHGIIFNPPYKMTYNGLKSCWKFGSVNWVERVKSVGAVIYCVKYMNDPQNLKDQITLDWYKIRRFVSAGLGRAFTEDPSARRIVHVPGRDGCPFNLEVICRGRAKKGFRYILPRYYKLKLFSEEELGELKRFFLYSPPPVYIDGIPYDSNSKELFLKREEKLLESINNKKSYPNEYCKFSKSQETPRWFAQLVSQAYSEFLSGLD